MDALHTYRNKRREEGSALKVEFYKHNLNQNDIDSVVEALHQNILTTGGKTAEFERRFSKYTGIEHTVGVTSCTAALHLALLAYGIGPGDEVITTPMTFIATANAILMAGAKPVFVDVETETGNIDASKIEDAITGKTKAIIPVHLYGTMCDMKALRKIADRYCLSIIEDCAHAVEANRDGVMPGQYSEAVCYSFYATKNLTCGEGGAVCTNNQRVAEKVKILRSHGMSSEANDRYSKRYKHWDMLELGWKYNMDNIQAALLINQVDRLHTNLRRKEAICQRYEQELKGIVDIPKVIGISGRHLFTIWVNNRDEVLGRLQDAGIGVVVNYRAIHLLTYYRKRFGYKEGDYPVAEKIGNSCISLPLYSKMTDEEVEYVIEAVRNAVR
jgi:dTDP-4-amino-4,6-dideoxygalactose transaminase